MKLFEIENKKNDLEMKNQMLDTRLEELKNEKQIIEDEMRAKMENDKGEMRKQIQSYQEKLQAAEVEKRNVEKNLIVARSENEKDLALLNQKVEFYEKQQSQFDRKEKELNEENTLLKKNQSAQVKELTNKYEEKLHANQAE